MGQNYFFVPFFATFTGGSPNMALQRTQKAAPLSFSLALEKI